MSNLEQAVDEALTQMYDEAEPPLDYQWAKNHPAKVDEDEHLQHYLSGERQEEIVEEVADQYDLNGVEKLSLQMETILNMGPTTVPLEDGGEQE